jgi:hypothetical protein
MVAIGDLADGADVAVDGDGEALKIWGPTHPGTQGRAHLPLRRREAWASAQLAQERELEAKLAEEYRAVRLLRAFITGEASARAERASELGK